jgi:hypothetical protein
MRFINLAILVALIGGCVDADPATDDLAADTAAILATPIKVRVTLTAQSGVSGTQRVNFAIPIAAGNVTDVARVRVLTTTGGALAFARQPVATWPDGSLRSVQLQLDVNPVSVPSIDVELGGTPTAASLAIADVSTTLMTSSGTTGPRVWARMPSGYLSASGVVGPMVSRGSIASTYLDAWQAICDYAAWPTDAFLALQSDRGVWLFDRPTAMYRGYAYTGSYQALKSAYREAAIYRNGITGTGSSTRIGVPGASGDLKYHYTQGLAIHYLLTGDVRFREAAENVAIRAHDLWGSPGYAGGDDFWTERHAGFGLLAYEWAAAVSDDRVATFAGWSDTAVTAYLAMQAVSANAWESDARCFAHAAEAHDEDYGYVGCSPWMSAILADGLDAYARRVGGTRAADARAGLVKLGRMIARHGLDAGGKPAYWMGAGVAQMEPDEYDEHWGESAYVVAMAWFHGGKTDAFLKATADALVSGTASFGEAGQMRSFNWQCRSAVATPYFLR